MASSILASVRISAVAPSETALLASRSYSAASTRTLGANLLLHRHHPRRNSTIPLGHTNSSSSVSSSTVAGSFSVTGAARGNTRARRRTDDDVQTLTRASSDEDPPSSYDDVATASTSLPTVIADSKWFNTYAHGAVFVFILGFIDAGYSGDWSRIGAISEETEQVLRGLAVTLGELHVAAAAAAGAVAAKRGLPVAPAAAKTLLIGFLAFLEVCFKTVPGNDGGDSGDAV